MPQSLDRRIGLFLIHCYQVSYRNLRLPSVCRFTPSCSNYAREAIEKYGLVQGTWMGLLRILRCHPFHPGGHDPVP